MKERIAHLNTTACYLKQDDKVLMIKLNKKCGQVYASQINENFIFNKNKKEYKKFGGCKSENSNIWK